MTIFEIFPDLLFHPIFQGADRQAILSFLNGSALRLVELSAGSAIYTCDETEVRVGFLLSGRAQAFTGQSREQTLLKTIRPHELFGIANLYAEDEPFPSRILAISDCRILWIGRDALKGLIENDAAVRRNFLAFQSKKILYLNRKIATLTAGNAEKKLAVCLLDHEDNGVFVPSGSMSELAELLGMGRASLYRAIDNLVSYGWIEREEKQIRILDKDALLRFI